MDILLFSLKDIATDWNRIAGITNLAIIILLMYNGTLMGSKHYTYIQLCGLIIIASFIMKLMHLKGADIVLLIPNPLIILIYADHFRQKKKKKALDLVKMLWVISSFICVPLIMLNVLPLECIYVSHVLLGVALILWLFERFNTEPEEIILDDDRIQD